MTTNLFDVHRTDISTGKSKTLGLVHLIARLAAAKTGGPYVIVSRIGSAQEGPGPQRTKVDSLRHLRALLKAGKVGDRFGWHPDSGPQYRIRIARGVTPVPTDGNSRIDLVVGFVLFGFKGITDLGTCVCKHISGTSEWSQHAFCNAHDFGLAGGWDAVKGRQVAASIVNSAEIASGTLYGIVEHVIVNDEIWTRGQGWSSYGGDYHYHVHVDCHPNCSGTPACAGGSNAGCN
jgi:hypothetical protein